jgi:hypothetical protein
MSISRVEIDSRELLSKVTIILHMPKMLGFRFWVAAKLIQLAGWVSMTNIVVEFDE